MCPCKTRLPTVVNCPSVANSAYSPSSCLFVCCKCLMPKKDSRSHGEGIPLMASACVGGGGREQSNMPHGVERRTMLFSRKALTPVFLFHLRPSYACCRFQKFRRSPQKAFLRGKARGTLVAECAGGEKNQNLIPSFARCNQDMEQNGEKENAAAAEAVP